MMFNPHYTWLAARLKLPGLPPPTACFAGVRFLVESEHYQLRSILKKGAIQPVLAQLLSLCDHRTLFLDIGANIGLFSLLVASETGARVLGFEPVQSTFHAYARNCALNPLLGISPFNLALGACPKAIEVTAIPGSGINQVVNVAERQGEPTQWAPQLALDQLCIGDLLGQRRQLVIKIDVERYEFEVLAGTQQLLLLDLPVAICVEVPLHEKGRLEQALGPRFRGFSPPESSRLPVDDEHDPSNLFYANDAWLHRA